MKSLNVLVERWRRQGLVVLSPATPEAVRDTFAALGSVATSDVISLYAQLDGMESSDDEDWQLWSLAEIRKENTEPSSFGVLFSDYMLRCWCCRIRPNADDTSAVLMDHFGGQEPTLVASSLAEFFDAYVAEPVRLLDPGSLRKTR